MSRRYQQEQRLELLTETALRMGAKWEKGHGAACARRTGASVGYGVFGVPTSG
jgi:hypothetical protein